MDRRAARAPGKAVRLRHRGPGPMLGPPMIIIDYALDAIGWLLDRVLPERQVEGPGMSRAQRLGILLVVAAVVAGVILILARPGVV